MWVVPAETVQNRDVLDAPTGMYSRHVSAGTTHSAANAATYLNEAVLRQLSVSLRNTSEDPGYWLQKLWNEKGNHQKKIVFSVVLWYNTYT